MGEGGAIKSDNKLSVKECECVSYKYLNFDNITDNEIMHPCTI